MGRKADYHKLTDSNLFLKFFCVTQWVEDKEVADRLIDLRSCINARAATEDEYTVEKL